MKSLIFITLLLFCLFNINAQEQNIRKLYVGTFTSEGAEGINLCCFNTETGDISLTKTFKGIDNPSFLKLSPNKDFLYVVTRSPKDIENSGGFVSAYKVKNNGDIVFLNKQISNGEDPCHVDVSHNGKYVAIAAYSGGTTSLYPIKPDGSLIPATSIIKNEGSGPNKKRQSKPHAHSIKFSPFSKQVFSADLGTDQLNIFNLENNVLTQNGQQFVKTEPGAGPRHLEFHPNGEIIFVINELNSTITSFKKEEARWKKQQTISTLPNNFEGASFCADIHISKDGKYLYGSNRGHNSITVFKVEENRLKKITTVATEGNWPRNFAIAPNGKFLLVANQKSGDITVFSINPETGIPTFTGKKLELPAPVCLEFL